MRPSVLMLTLSLSTAAVRADDAPPPVPPDYPSHRSTRECGDAQELRQLRESLMRYNLSRVEIAAVLRKMAAKYRLEGDTRTGLLAFASSFEQMRQNLPAPDPDSAEFRNFDFRLGLSFAALTLYLNTRDPSLARHFSRDRGDPGSDLGLYLASLDSSRAGYFSQLERATARHRPAPGQTCR